MYQGREPLKRTEMLLFVVAYFLNDLLLGGFRKMSVNDVKPEKPVSTLWGCELNETSKTGAFKTDDSKHQHQLALRTMCLGASANDEFNIVEVVTGEDESQAFPMATLRASVMPTVNLSGVDLHPPITFRLKHGSGPVYICGEHVALEEDYMDDEMDDGELPSPEEQQQLRERSQRWTRKWIRMAHTLLMKMKTPLKREGDERQWQRRSEIKRFGEDDRWPSLTVDSWGQLASPLVTHEECLVLAGLMHMDLDLSNVV
ncbi:hypothetical protein AAFF_G00400930 [Aldrovandia affinis]|uniref:Nucleoplasmin core domain-containing protein n=1 Tax=Aldrovandia affinis TaxID=143900 RepID=A0AAD7SCS2_9TELE|nr:hypothetical protein AAFF_G00400930 [Aldrovandia affinis]